jgi:predicted RNA binding protein YcfA (HicA-like mRNA interferase family)
MSQIEKKVEKFLNNPTSAKLADIMLILKHHGFEKVPAKGSHVKFKHSQLPRDLVIPVHKGDCKNFYKEEAKKQIKKINR